MKTAILTCVNDRRHISPLIFECYKRLKESFDVSLIVGYTSKEDETMVVQWAVEDSGVHPVGPIENIPGKKWNTVLKYAYDSVSKFDKFLIMGDDDSISTTLFHHLVLEEYDYLGVSKSAFVDCSTGSAMIETQKMPNKLIGAGRMISRHAITQTCFRKLVKVGLDFRAGMTKYSQGTEMFLPVNIADYLTAYGKVVGTSEVRYVGLWPDGAKHSLDHHSELNLVMNGFVPVGLQLDKIHVTDFKTTEGANIWPYSILENRCKPCSFDDATWFMNERELEIVKQNRK